MNTIADLAVPADPGRRIWLRHGLGVSINASMTASLTASLAGSLTATITAPVSAAPSAQPQDGKRLIVIMLRGALDGLSAVVPYTEANYYKLRPTIAVPQPGEAGGALDLDGRFGLHPSLAMLMPYFRDGRLGFVHAAGSPDPTRSHFDAQDYMESGTPGRKATGDGWLNRLLGALDYESLRLRAINVGPVMPRIFAGAAPIATIATGDAASRPTAIDQPAIIAAFGKLYQGDDAMSLAFREATATRKEIVAGLSGSDEQADNGAISLRGFAQDAARLGGLLRRDARAHIGFIAVGGWDTHVNQGSATGQLANKLGLLGDGLVALAKSLGERFAETTIVVMSEFGRTVRQNGNGGTDHGHGNLIWLLGGAVNGSAVHGTWPGLDESALYEGRDLAVTTDFRLVLADILQRQFKLSESKLAQVLPGLPKATLNWSALRS